MAMSISTPTPVSTLPTRKKGTPRPTETYRAHKRNGRADHKLARHARRIRWRALGLAR